MSSLQYQRADKTRFEALDGCRGLFALAVVFVHLKVAGHLFGQPFVRGGYLAVDFFFVLSGFVITHSSRTRLHDLRSLGDFMWRRFARLWPLHACVLLLFIGLEGAKYLAASRAGVAVDVPAFAPGTRFDASVLPAHFLLVHSLGLFSMATWNWPSWSISCEYWAYLVFALATLLLRRRTALFALLIVVAAQTLLLLLVPTMDTTWDYGLVRCLLGFSLGHLIYLAHQRFALGRARAGDARGQFWAALEATAALAALSFMSLAGDTRWSLAAPLLFAPVIFVFAQERGTLSRLLRSAPIAALGRWSYAIYMTHEVVFLCLNRGMRVAGRRWGFEPFSARFAANPDPPIDFGSVWLMDCLTLTALIGVLCAAFLAHRLIERPAQAYLGGLLRRASPQPEALPAAAAGELTVSALPASPAAEEL